MSVEESWSTGQREVMLACDECGEVSDYTFLPDEFQRMIEAMRGHGWSIARVKGSEDHQHICADCMEHALLAAFPVIYDDWIEELL